MTARTAEEQIRELARELAPVRPIPRLRVVAAAAVSLALVALAVEWLLGGPGPRQDVAFAWASLPYLATLAGLATVAVGATLAGLAAAVPGRDASAQLGARAAVFGLVLALAGGTWALVRAGSPAGEDLWACLWCIGRAHALGVAPTLLSGAFIAYAAVRRPGLAAALALGGSVALGAAAVHATCPSDSPMHWILAHSLAPVAAVLLLTAPLAALLARFTRRD